MPLYLHGECAEAHKEQVKDASVPNEEERARKQTCATTWDDVGRSEGARELEFSPAWRWYPRSSNEQPAQRSVGTEEGRISY